MKHSPKLKRWIGKAYFDPAMFARTGRSIDILRCPNYHGDCKCRQRCIVCTFGVHSPWHGPIFRQPVGSMPWGHEFAERIAADDLPACVQSVEQAVARLGYSDAETADLRQEVLLSLLTEGRPLDLTERVRAKARVVFDWHWSRHRLRSIDSPIGDNLTLADTLIG